jgi:hypothetical protein
MGLTIKKLPDRQFKGGTSLQGSFPMKSEWVG